MITCWCFQKVTAIISAVIYNFHCMFWGAIYCYLILFKTCKLLSEGQIFNFLMTFCASHHCNMQVLYTNDIIYFHSILCGQSFMVFLFFLVYGCLVGGNRCMPEFAHLICEPQRFGASEPLAVAVTLHAQYLLVIAAAASQAGTAQGRVFKRNIGTI